MNNTIYNKDIKQHKFILYSAHDSTVCALLSALHYPKFVGQPPYASHIAFELLQSTETTKYFVNISFNGEVFPIKGCKMPCEYTNFLQLVSDSVPENWDDDCKLDIDNISKFSLLAAFFVVVIVIPILFMIIGKYFNKANTKEFSYSPLPSKSL